MKSTASVRGGVAAAKSPGACAGQTSLPPLLAFDRIFVKILRYKG
jgi:hypothetical protein